MQKPLDIDAQLASFRAANPDMFNLYSSEAIFGWREVGEDILNCRRGLEIGAGAGLLSYLAAQQSGGVIEGIEPVAEGFGSAEAILESVEQIAPDNLRLHRCRLDDFNASTKFDLIWSVNVFEHLPDWRSALLKTRDLLSADGKAILLFPNYDIPYEPHFRLPLIGGRHVARRTFARCIDRYETAVGGHGLWDSLNFIKASDLRQFAREKNLNIEIDKSITVRMFERLNEDDQLKARQGIWSLPATLFRLLRLHHLWAALPNVTQPYLRVILYATR